MAEARSCNNPYYVTISARLNEGGSDVNQSEKNVGIVYELTSYRGEAHGGYLPQDSYRGQDRRRYIQASLISNQAGLAQSFNMLNGQMSSIKAPFSEIVFKRRDQEVSGILMFHHSLVLDSTGATYYPVCPLELEGIEPYNEPTRAEVLRLYYMPITNVRRFHPLERRMWSAESDTEKDRVRVMEEVGEETILHSGGSESSYQNGPGPSHHHHK